GLEILLVATSALVARPALGVEVPAVAVALELGQLRADARDRGRELGQVRAREHGVGVIQEGLEQAQALALTREQLVEQRIAGADRRAREPPPGRRVD